MSSPHDLPPMPEPSSGPSQFGKSVSPERLRSVVFIVVPKNSILYHGNTFNYEGKLEPGPLFFTDHETALRYSRNARNRFRCRAFRTQRDLKMIDFSDRRNFYALIHEAKRRRLNYKIIEEYSGLVYRNMMRQQEITANSEHIRIDTDYGNLAGLMTEFICGLGFDGWIIPHDLPRGGQLKGTDISSEILICNAANHVEDLGDCRHYSQSVARLF